MFSVKVFLKKDSRDQSFSKSFVKILNYLKNMFNDDLSIINDSNCVEVTSGTPTHKDDGIKVELLFKKTIYINKDNFEEDLRKEIENFNKNID